MGFYDNRCMITGVSLRGSNAALVLLEKTGPAYHPLALALKGNYDRFGSIDGVENDANTKLVLKYFLRTIKSGEFAITDPYFRTPDGKPIKSIEQVLRPFERNMNDGHENTVDGKQIVFALICQAVWDACAQSAPRRRQPPRLFKELFDESTIPTGIYGRSLSSVSTHLAELTAIRELLENRQLPWKPSEADGAQHSGKEMQKYLRSARRKFRNLGLVLDGLSAYESEVEECLAD